MNSVRLAFLMMQEDVLHDWSAPDEATASNSTSGFSAKPSFGHNSARGMYEGT